MGAKESREKHELELISRAKAGDAEAGRHILRRVTLLLDTKHLDSPLIPFLSECLREFEEGVPIERALCVETDVSRGGRPRKYVPAEVAAVDILLRRECGLGLDESLSWIEASIGVGRKEAREYRKQYDANFNSGASEPLSEQLEIDDLLSLSGSLREHAYLLLEQKGKT